MIRTAVAVLAGLAISACVVTTYAEDETGSEKALEEKVSEVQGKLDGLEESYLETMGTVKKLAKLKVSGYLQAQFAYAETLGVKTSNRAQWLICAPPR